RSHGAWQDIGRLTAKQAANTVAVKRKRWFKSPMRTGCFLLLMTGGTAVTSRNHLLTTVAWRRGGRTDYALEGSVFIAGAVVQWLRDGLKIIRSTPDVEALAASVKDNRGVYLVPAFAGLGAPHWDAYARGAIFGRRAVRPPRTSPAPRWRRSRSTARRC